MLLKQIYLMNSLVISLIPAKGQSSKNKNKNFLKIEKKSLFEIAILNSIKSKNINYTFVSSESEKILKIAKKYECKSLKRPNNLALKKTKGIEVIKHFLRSLDKNLKKANPIIIILQPTSPLRSVLDIEKSIRIFIRKKLRFLISVKKNKVSPFKDMFIKNKKLVPLTNKKNLLKNRQVFPQTYRPNGAIFMFRYKEFIKNKFFLNNAYPYIMNEISSLDIDTINDYQIAKKYFRSVHGKLF